MKVKIQVIIESDDGRVQDVEEVACLKRGTLTPEELGLNLAEAKEILQSVQRSMTEHQVGGRCCTDRVEIGYSGTDY